MEYWQYTLTGFSDFLEQRRIAFAEPLPACRICSICGRLPSSTAMLPCGHVSCEQCRGEFFEGMECPFDGRAFTQGQVVWLCFQLSDLDNLRVFCLVGGNKCPTFAGKLSELRDHMRHCRSVGGQCAKCHRLVPSALAVDHYKRCCDGARLLGTGMAIFWKPLRNQGLTPGPYRAASKPGVFIATCVFADVYSAHDSSKEGRNENSFTTDNYTLGGYTFSLECEFSFSEGVEDVQFAMFLRRRRLERLRRVAFL
ncbi:hypothetical protein MTO96_024432 [Rhipicephalus appendiculatus]